MHSQEYFNKPGITLEIAPHTYKNQTRKSKGECGSWWAWGKLANLLLIFVTLIWTDWSFIAKPELPSCLNP